MTLEVKSVGEGVVTETGVREMLAILVSGTGCVYFVQIRQAVQEFSPQP